MKEDFTVYRGFSTNQNEIDSFEYILNETKAKENEEGFDINQCMFHYQQFASTSFNKEVTEEFALKNAWGDRIPVIMEINIKLHQGLYSGFQMNRPEYTAYPEEKEFLITDGADYIIKSVEKKIHEKFEGKEYVHIVMDQINTWQNPDSSTPKDLVQYKVNVSKAVDKLDAKTLKDLSKVKEPGAIVENVL